MKKLYLSKKDKKIFGLCSGLSKALDIDVTLIRLGVVFLCLITGFFPLIITYIIAGIIAPDEP